MLLGILRNEPPQVQELPMDWEFGCLRQADSVEIRRAVMTARQNVWVFLSARRARYLLLLVQSRKRLDHHSIRNVIPNNVHL